MRTVIISTLWMLITVQSYAIKKDPSYRDARKNGAMAKMELRITNDMGVPIPNASVHVLMGMNFRERSYDIDGKSDTNGLFVVEGNTTGNEIIIEVTKDRYYKGAKTFFCKVMPISCRLPA